MIIVSTWIPTVIPVEYCIRIRVDLIISYLATETYHVGNGWVRCCCRRHDYDHMPRHNVIPRFRATGNQRRIIISPACPASRHTTSFFILLFPARPVSPPFPSSSTVAQQALALSLLATGLRLYIASSRIASALHHFTQPLAFFLPHSP